MGLRPRTQTAALGLLVVAGLGACGDDLGTPARAVPVTLPEWTGEAPPISALANYGIPSDVMVAAITAVQADPFLLEVLGPDYEIVGTPAPVVDGTEYIKGIGFTLRTPEPVVLPPGMPTWKARNEGDTEPLEPILTDEASEASIYFTLFVRTDYSIEFLYPLPNEFGDRWAASTTTTTAAATTAAEVPSASSEAATTIAWVTVAPRSAPPFTATLPVPSYTMPDETFPPDTGPPPSTYSLDTELPDYEWRVEDEMTVRMATPDHFRQHPYGRPRVGERERQIGLYALQRWLVLDDSSGVAATFSIQPNYGPDWPPVALQEYSETIIAGDLTWNLWNNATVEDLGAEPNMGMALVGDHALMISGSLEALHTMVGTISVELLTN